MREFTFTISSLELLWFLLYKDSIAKLCIILNNISSPCETLGTLRAGPSIYFQTPSTCQSDYEVTSL